MAKIVVVALGGNAITRSGQVGSYPEQAANVRPMAEAVCSLRDDGWTVVVVHGNGPQVGNLAVQQEEGAHRVPQLPLFLLDAMTEGHLGSLLGLAIRQAGAVAVASVLTHVVVDERDPAFAHPTKPIGPFLGEDEARSLSAARGWMVGDDAGRGWRRMVPSPAPLEIVELAELRTLVERGVVVIAAGGGGVPVVPDGPGYRGVDAVIDKDLAAQRLATELAADALLMVTDVPRVMLDYGTDRARPVAEMTVDEAQAHADHHKFPAGSMGPKITAAIQFVRAGGRLAAITDVSRACVTLAPAVNPDAGTRIVARHSAAQPKLGAAS